MKNVRYNKYHDDFGFKFRVKSKIIGKIIKPALKSPRKALARAIMGEKLWNENVFDHTCINRFKPKSASEFLMTVRVSATHEHIPTFQILNRILKLKKILEIGVFDGSTTIPFLESAIENDGFVTSIDIVDCIEAKRRVKELGYEDRWKFIQLDSLDVTWNESIDHLYIDGLHTYEHLTKELEKYEPFVKSNTGIITIHDLMMKGVSDAVDDYIKGRTDLVYKRYFNGTGLAVIIKN